LSTISDADQRPEVWRRGRLSLPEISGRRTSAGKPGSVSLL